VPSVLRCVAGGFSFGGPEDWSSRCGQLHPAAHGAGNQSAVALFERWWDGSRLRPGADPATLAYVARVLILGGGFGGITVATELRRLGDEHEAVLVDRAEPFSMGLRKLWEMVGEGTIADGSRSRRLLERHGIEVRLEEVQAIDPTDFDADFLVVALGAEARPDLVPGLEEHGHDVWRKESIPALTRALSEFDGGRLVVAITGGPYPCPPAPFECVMLLDEWLRKRGVREATELAVITFQPILLPNAGKQGSAWLADRLDELGIEHATGRTVERVEAGRVVHPDGDTPFDLLIGVPPHRPPAVVGHSPLGGDGGWVTVDPHALTTSYERVYAIGDLTKITLANGLPLPKAGLMAELQGQVVAAAIAGQTARFDGHGYCYLEMGRARASLIDGEFFAGPEPAVHVSEPSREAAESKRRFESERLERWFGG
jgi:sulfide:quinone oxidoreductase